MRLEKDQKADLKKTISNNIVLSSSSFERSSLVAKESDEATWQEKMAIMGGGDDKNVYKKICDINLKSLIIPV